MLTIKLQQDDGIKLFKDGSLIYFDSIYWITIALRALVGLSVGLAIKFGSSLLKAFTSSIASVFFGIIAIFAFKFIPTNQFFQGAFLSLIAPIIFTAFPPEQEKFKPRKSVHFLDV